ncbi:thioesterase II family protein [Psychrobacter sp. VH5]|uniref:thioesterase II family protein n=1 Tax=Psychrobacter sp. VH5 TaxID=3423439 RepID=UPI003D659812
MTSMNNCYHLFCLPPAGSSSAIYRAWQPIMAKTCEHRHIKVIPIEYPGHGSRSGQPLVNDPNVLAADIAQTIMSYKDMPYILFGHSVGGALLWTVIDHLRTQDALGLLALVVVSSRPTPQYLQHICGRQHLTDDEIIEKLTHYNNFPSEILQNTAALNYFLTIIRNDFSVSDQLICQQLTNTPAPLTAPLIVFYGIDDPDIEDEAMMQAWQAHSEVFLGCHALTGDHFYFLNPSSRAQMLKKIEEDLLYALPHHKA